MIPSVRSWSAACRSCSAVPVPCRNPAPDATDERLLLRSTILAAANKMYLDCCFDALRQEQALWEDILPDLA